jgi:hypothetical protein
MTHRGTVERTFLNSAVNTNSLDSMSDEILSALADKSIPKVYRLTGKQNDTILSLRFLFLSTIYVRYERVGVCPYDLTQFTARNLNTYNSAEHLTWSVAFAVRHHVPAHLTV